MKKQYYLLSEGEISMIVIDIKEALENVERIIKNKKLTVNDSKNCKISFDEFFLDGEN